MIKGKAPSAQPKKIRWVLHILNESCVEELQFWVKLLMKVSVLLPTAFSNLKIIALKALGRGPHKHVLPNLKLKKFLLGRWKVYECFVLSFLIFANHTHLPYKESLITKKRTMQYFTYMVHNVGCSGHYAFGNVHPSSQRKDYWL